VLRRAHVSHAPFDPRTKVQYMLHHAHEPFDAWLPRLTASIRISTLHDAQVFARRWVIRDKDPELKSLLRRVDRVNGSDAALLAMNELRAALAKRGLLSSSRTDLAGAAADAPANPGSASLSRRP
jgi:hypothetical protein